MKPSYRKMTLVQLASMMFSAAIYSEAQVGDARQQIQQAVASGNVQAVIEVLPTLEEMWPKDIGEYFKSVEEAVRFLGNPIDAPAVRQAVELLYTEVMNKRCPEDATPDQAAAYFKGKEKIVAYLFGYDDMRYEQFYLLPASRFLGEIRERAIPDYLNKTISFREAEIRVLDEAEVSFASDLKEPNDIAAYEKALKEDERTKENDRLQRELFSANSSITTRLLYACRQLRRDGKLDEEFANEVAENARLTEKEREMRYEFDRR